MPRPIAIKRYVALMHARGLPAKSILADAGIDLSRLADPAYFVDPIQCRSVVAGLLRSSEDNGIGLDVGLTSTLTDLGVVGHAAMTCKTVRDTHRLWGQFGDELVGITCRLEIIKETSSAVTLEFSNLDPDDPFYRFYVEEMLGMLYMIGQPMLGEPPFALDATFKYKPPPHEHRYHELFNCPMRFGSARTTIKIQRGWFEGNLRTYDEDFNQVCLRYCEEAVHRIGSVHTIISDLRKMFLRLSGPPPKLEDAAKILKMSQRTLSRRLQEEGTNYREQLDAFRRDRACEYLKYPDISTKEIAYLLGFNEPSAFRHAFKIWTGKTVSEFQSQESQKASGNS